MNPPILVFEMDPSQQVR